MTVFKTFPVGCYLENRLYSDLGSSLPWATPGDSHILSSGPPGSLLKFLLPGQGSGQIKFFPEINKNLQCTYIRTFSAKTCALSCAPWVGLQGFLHMIFAPGTMILQPLFSQWMRTMQFSLELVSKWRCKTSHCRLQRVTYPLCSLSGNHFGLASIAQCRVWLTFWNNCRHFLNHSKLQPGIATGNSSPATCNGFPALRPRKIASCNISFICKLVSIASSEFLHFVHLIYRMSQKKGIDIKL